MSGQQTLATQTTWTPAGTTGQLALSPPQSQAVLPAVDSSNTAMVVTNGSSGPLYVMFGTGGAVTASPALAGCFIVPAGATAVVPDSFSPGTATIAAIWSGGGGVVSITRGTMTAASVVARG
jgi:hypothetical protein